MKTTITRNQISFCNLLPKVTGTEFPFTRKGHFAMLAAVSLLGHIGSVAAQTSYTSTSATTAWNTSRWNNDSDGPGYGDLFTANNNVLFSSGSYSFAGMGASTNVGNVTVANNVTVNFASTSGSFATNSAVRTFNIGTGSIFDFNATAISVAGSTGFVKNGEGVLGTGIGDFKGGFTLNEGTVIARGQTGMGSGATNVLTLTGGTLASNNSRNFESTRFGGGIVVGGNVQFGELATKVSIASSTANLVFANDVSLGATTRTFTIGNNGTHTFSGVLSGGATTGLTVAAAGAVTGRVILSGLNNTYSGPTTITSGILQLGSAGAIAASPVVLNGGTLTSSFVGTIQTTGTLSLNSGTNSIIDFGSGVGNTVLEFGNSSGASWLGSVRVDNWQGSVLGGAGDQFKFTTGGLDSPRIAQVTFKDPFGLAAGTYGATLVNGNELVPVPEPAALLTSVVLAGTALFRRRRA